MKFLDIFNIVIVLCIVAIIIMKTYAKSNIENIKKNWPMYKCNPLFMPFASIFGHNPGENFIQCIQSSSSSFVKYGIEPISHQIKQLSTIASQNQSALNSAREENSQRRKSLGFMGISIIGIFSNVLIQFQKMIINIRSLVGRLIAIITTTLYMFDGSYKAVKSVWNGPPGWTIRQVAKWTPCFHPNTLVKLQNKEVKPMRMLNIGDVLQNGTVVYATMKIKNTDKDGNIIAPFYEFKNQGVNNSAIHVTGSHLIRRYDNVYTYVEKHPLAKLSTNTSDTLTCLITNDHTIPIGDLVFGDWEDGGELPDTVFSKEEKVIL